MEKDLLNPLVSKYRLNRRVRRVEYEGLHEICFHCGRYGHEINSCPLKRAEETPKSSKVLVNNQIFVNNDTRPELEEDFGPWMVAKRRTMRSKILDTTAESRRS
ncbi:hypothetical protein LINPERHAP2_LOCUS7425 [Linum perenne]